MRTAARVSAEVRLVPHVLPPVGAAGGDSGSFEVVVVGKRAMDSPVPAEILRETKNVSLRMTRRDKMRLAQDDKARQNASRSG